MEKKLQDICDYYKQETSLDLSAKVIAMLTSLQEEAGGYLSGEVQKAAAKAAGVNAGYITAIIKTIPSLHAAPFRHHIQVCISDRCKSNGSMDILKVLQDLLHVKPGQVTRDKSFLLTTSYCMRSCAHGANIKIDGTLYQEVKPADLPGLLQKYRKKNGPL